MQACKTVIYKFILFIKNQIYSITIATKTRKAVERVNLLRDYLSICENNFGRNMDSKSHHD